MATQLMERITNGNQAALQPPHWLAEVGAVLARESPDTAADDVTMLAAWYEWVENARTCDWDVGS
jgi:hypothetical protein